jgi:glycosyltransferase involved in cell wall biosynthesis
MIKDAWKVKVPALKYLQNYGALATFRKATFILSKGGLSYFDSSPVARSYENSDLLNFSEVIFISNDLASVSHEYRVKNLSRAYWEMGITNVILDTHQFRSLNSAPRKAKLIYFWRTNIDLENLEWFQEAKLKGVKFAYDSDDLTFDERYYNDLNVTGLRYIPKEEALHLIHIVCQEQAKQIKQSDIAVAGTQQLADSFKYLEINTVSIPNFAPRWMEVQAEKIRLSRPRNTNPDRFKIVYASGSRTHQRDFLAAKDAIFDFLEANRNATFTVIGAAPFENDQIPTSIKSQINFIPMVKHVDLLMELINFDVHIAPLEIMNPYVEAKSSLKFIHAGLLVAPIIATPTKPFKTLITNGVDGLLATNKLEWLDALERLKDSRYREGVGKAALRNVLDNSLTDSAYRPLKELLQSKVEPNLTLSKLGNSDRTKKIVWVLPNLMIGSGGHRNVFRLASRIQSSAQSNTICFTDDSRDPVELKKLINQHYLTAEFSVEKIGDAIIDADLVIGTHFSTIGVIKAKVGKNQKISYLVQDFEPWFYPMSESYLIALQTYFDEEISIFTSGTWMSEKIYEITGRKVSHFQLPIDKNIYKETENHQREGILFFAKEDTPRRLYDFGLRCLELIHSIDPTVNIYFYGSKKKKVANFPFTDLGQLPTLEKLSGLYSRAKVGLAFSPTNPSLIPYEMMACGLPIVDIDLPGKPMHKFGSLSETITCEFNEFEVASRIIRLISDEELWRKTSKEGLNFIDQMPDEDEASNIVREFILNILGD